MADGLRKLVVSTLICCAVGFGVLLLVSLLEFSLERTMPQFTWQWIMARTWAQFLSFLPVGLAWAVLLTFSWVLPVTGTDPAAGTSFEHLGGPVLTVLVLSLVFAAVRLVAYPAAAATVESLEFSSTVARELRLSARRAREAFDYSRAADDLRRYLALVGDDVEVEDELADLLNRLDSAVARPAAVEPAAARLPRDSTARELIDRATAADRSEDYSTAHYMASLALALDPVNDEAARIAAESLQRIREAAPAVEEETRRRFFAGLTRAKESVTRAEYIDAYYELQALATENPSNLDVRRYLALADGELQRIAVFRDEVEEALALPGTLDVAFVNRSTPDYVEFLYLGKVVRTSAGLYAGQIELLRQAADGRAIHHLAGDFGKYVEGHLVLRVVDREEPERTTEPRVFTGPEHAASLVRLEPDADALWLLATASRNPEVASIADLTRIMSGFARYGLLTEPLELEFLSRLSTPLVCLILAYFTMGVAWRYRSRYLHHPPVITLLLVPAAPLVIVPFYLLADYSQRLLSAVFLLAFRFPVALGLQVAVQAVALTVSLTYLALGSRE